MPELLWKAYIDFEIEEGDREKARSLYERLVNLSGHHKVWISYAEFEGSSIPVPRALREEEDDDEEAEPKVVEGDASLAESHRAGKLASLNPPVDGLTADADPVDCA